MSRIQLVARTVPLTVIVFALATRALAQGASSPPAGDAQYISLTPAEFAQKAPDLIGKDVEINGDIQRPAMLSARSVGTIVDKDTGKVLVQLTARPGSPALEYLTGGDAGKTQGVFVRGKVVMGRGNAGPVLELSDISKDSKIAAAAANKERVETITNKEQAGLVKEVLPPHTNPSGEAAKAWLDRIPTTEPSYDRAKSVYDNMQAHANYRAQVEVDDQRAIIRGPQRPANFETYYRGVRDTGLANLFAQAPYQNPRTSWPRVMIVIEEKPKFNGGMPSEFWRSSTKTETDYTWRFHATIWTDATHSIDIAPFNWAFSEMRFNTPYADVPIWGQTPMPNVPPPAGMTASSDPKTPTPVAPRIPLPDSVDYRRTFHYNAIMVGNVLLDMGFDYRRRDGRVWFVEDLAK